MHRRVPGRSLAGGDVDAATLAGMLSKLHAVPAPAVMAALCACNVDLDRGSRYASLATQIELRVFPLLEASLAARVEHGLETFLESECDTAGPIRLVHGDLGTDHILVDPETRRISGGIDFEAATLGDPAIDLVGIRLSLGASVAREVICRHPFLDAGACERLDFYTWMGSVHAIIYGLDAGVPEEVPAGIAGHEQRVGWGVARA